MVVLSQGLLSGEAPCQGVPALSSVLKLRIGDGSQCFDLKLSKTERHSTVRVL